MTQNRHPRGIPAGGEFAANTHDEQDAPLRTDLPDHDEGMNADRTSEPLQRITMHPSSFTIAEYLRDDEHMLLEAPYQRGSVWDDDQRRSLIRSLVMGIPVGSIIANDRGYDDEENERAFGSRHLRAIIDGKQRVETVRAFSNGEFAIPADWLEERFLDREQVAPDGTVTIDGLSQVGIRMFHSLPLPMLRTHVGSVEQEAEIFRLVNSGGTAQTDETMVRAAEVESGRR